jgi:hypothetical protein
MTSHGLQTSFAGRFVAATLTVFLAAFTLTSCLNDDNLIGENCYDEILNNGEELVDCGGPICDPCDPCENGVWNPLLGEQWVDCGGSCEPCATEFNGQLDEGETGIDCGCDGCPACPELCGDGLLNGYEQEVDCGGVDCDPCPTCDDLELNGDESGIDCGGVDCEPCECLCDCTNGIQDGLEDYIDCGGPNCEPCAAEITWMNAGVQYFGDATATAELVSGNLQITGVSLTGAQLGFVVAEPIDGWYNGYSVALNATALPQAGAYTNTLGVNFTTLFGGNTTLVINYIDAVSGGYVVGTFSGSMMDASGTATAISGGQFQLPIN